MRIPLYIPLAREHAATFRKGVDLYREYWSQPHHPFESGSSNLWWSDFWLVVGPYVPENKYRAERFEFDVPVVIEKALIWANINPPPTPELLSKAHQYLEAALADWTAAWESIGKVATWDRTRLGKDHWFWESVNLASVRQRQAAKLFAEGWPLISEADEKQALAEMKAGEAVELDDAFARIAGLSKEGWLDRVSQHKKRTTQGGK